MHIHVGRFGLVLLAAAGCGEAEPEFAEFAELCGVAGPVRVLEHGADETVYYRHQRVGQRLIFALGPTDLLYPNRPYESIYQEQLWTTGLCGESPTRLDERYRDMFVIDRWPEVVLVCDGDGIYSLGGAGPLEPHLVFPGGRVRRSGRRSAWSSRTPRGAWIFILTRKIRGARSRSR